MTAEEYRQRMIQAFHNADCDELIAICVLPTEKEFEHLEWLLKNHYKKAPCEDAIHNEREQAYMKGYEDASKKYRTEPCDDAISRTDAIRIASGYCHWSNIPDELAKLPSVNPIPCEDAISRQETIEWLKRVTKTDGITFETGFKQIIHDIEQMPSVSTENPNRCGEDVTCTVTCAVTCTDAISRQEAIDAIREETCGCCWDAKDILKNLPPISTEKTGRWIDDEFGSKCSCCGIHTHLDKFDRPMKFKHCSMCGAKMIEPQAEIEE